MQPVNLGVLNRALCKNAIADVKILATVKECVMDIVTHCLDCAIYCMQMKTSKDLTTLLNETWFKNVIIQILFTFIDNFVEKTVILELQ